MRSLRALNIRKVDHLAKQLRFTPPYLTTLCARADQLYRAGEVKKKSGETRVLYKPERSLKEVQRRINALLQRVELPEYMHGCRPGHSIVDNATPHVGKPMVLKIDVKDFFPSIRPHHVYKMLTRLGCSPDVARLLTRLTTYKHQLPQGAPTSPVVANLVYAGTARRLRGLADAHSSEYDNYVDDNTFSGPQHLSRLVPLVTKILRPGGFQVKPEKIQALDGSQEQVVTGVRVNAGLDVPRPFIRQTEELIDKLARQRGG